MKYFLREILFSIVCFLIYSLGIHAQNFEWAKWTHSADCKAICIDADGNSYITGEFWGSIGATFGDIKLDNPPFISTCTFIAKYDAGGKCLWAEQSYAIGENSRASGTGISVDKFGNCYVTGNFEGKENFGGNELTVNDEKLKNPNRKNVFIAKYDGNGNCLWAIKTGINGNTESTDITVEKNGNFYITGSIWRSKPKFGKIQLIADGFTQDLFIAKYDSEGNIIWAKQSKGLNNGSFSLASGISASGISIDTKGNSYIIGNLYNTSIFGRVKLTSNNTQNIFIVKYDPNGNCIWAKQSESNNDVIAPKISVDKNGNSYITGNYKQDLKLGNFQLNSNNTSCFLAKYDVNGNCVWAKQSCIYNNPNSFLNWGNSSCIGDISIDTSRNIYVIGNFSDTVIFGNTKLIAPNQYQDIFVTKYDLNGNCIWAKQTEGVHIIESNFELRANGKGISVDANGNCFIIGSFNSQVIRFDKIEINSLMGGGGFIAKIGNSKTNSITWIIFIIILIIISIFGMFYIMQKLKNNKITRSN